MSQRQLQIKVDEEFLELIPRPNSKERKSMKQSILEDGQLVPIVLNPSGMILDGHTRYEICQELRIKPKFTVKKFKTKKDERQFVIMSNIARRHLTKFQKIELAWEIYENEKEKALVRMNWRKQIDVGRTEKGQFVKEKLPEYLKKKGNAMEVFGKYMETGHTVIHQVDWLKKNASEKTLQQLRDGDINISRAYDLEKGLSNFNWNRKLNPNFRKRKNFVIPKICPKCETDTILVTKKPCHVHKKVCCQKCKWGY